MTLTRTIRTLKLGPLTIRIETLLTNDMGARHHHRRIAIRRLLLADGADKNTVKDIRRRQRNRHRHFLGRRPVRAVDPHDFLSLCEQREGDAACGCGDEERGFWGQAEQGAEFFDEGGCGFVPGGFVVEEGVVGGVVDVLVVGEGAHQLADFARVAVLEVFEGCLGVLEGC